MSGKSGNKKFPSPAAPAHKPTHRPGAWDIRGVQEDAVKLAPPQVVGMPAREYSAKTPLPNYTYSDDSVRHATMLESGGGISGAVNTKLCVLVLILAVVILSALTITALVVGRHPSHSGLKKGELVPAGAIANGPNDLVFDLSDGSPRPIDVITYYYSLVLSDDVQQWQTFPKEDVPLAHVNSSIHKISSYDVCCFSDQREWICAIGHTFDAYAFEARLRSVSESTGGIQCRVYINSRHLARSQCTLEIRVRS
jgi:hypothetical protein